MVDLAKIGERRRQAKPQRTLGIGTDRTAPNDQQAQIQRKGAVSQQLDLLQIAFPVRSGKLPEGGQGRIPIGIGCGAQMYQFDPVHATTSVLDSER
ncbi:MAG: hypothetical protein V2L15_04215 [Desulfobacteraceae bacterium]|jgi:hypothetical protein|nr:hypothetical protein [Desulfobacteraceae bacterium]